MEIGNMIPPFELMSTDGETLNVWDYKGHRNLALAFLPAVPCPDCPVFLDTAVRIYPQYEEEQTEMVVIVKGTQEQAIALKDRFHTPFPVLFDPTGEVTTRYADTVPSVVVTDRFGEVRAIWTGKLPEHRQILDVVELANLECPECGAPVDWR
ncbi:MAG: peroxiredoxin family protein [Armatimonadota bacterium]